MQQYRQTIIELGVALVPPNSSSRHSRKRPFAEPRNRPSSRISRQTRSRRRGYLTRAMVQRLHHPPLVQLLLLRRSATLACELKARTISLARCTRGKGIRAAVRAATRQECSCGSRRAAGRTKESWSPRSLPAVTSIVPPRAKRVPLSRWAAAFKPPSK